MTDAEYSFLVNHPADVADAAWFQAGTDCFENGWIDVFGLITPKGKKAMENYLEELLK